MDISAYTRRIWTVRLIAAILWDDVALFVNRINVCFLLESSYSDPVVVFARIRLTD